MSSITSLLATIMAASLLSMLVLPTLANVQAALAIL